METFDRCPSCHRAHPPADIHRCAQCGTLFCTSPDRRACKGRCPNGCDAARERVGKTTGRVE